MKSAVDEKRSGLGFNTGFLFGGIGVLTTITIWFYVPEPSMRNAAEMDEIYEKGVPAWKMHKYVTDVQRGQEEILHKTDYPEKA